MRIIILLIAVFIYNSGLGCSCALNNNVKKAYKRSDFVISAKVIEIIPPKPSDTVITEEGKVFYSYNLYRDTVKLELISIYKGKEITKISTIIGDGSNCTYYFEVGKEYLIYGWQENGSLNTSVCNRTDFLFGNQDLDFLKRKYKRVRTSKAKKR
ncbi:MAG: hypothetical protein ACPGVD_10530 [Flavobacteriales bacterium]